jgi:hypothetical protein
MMALLLTDYARQLILEGTLNLKTDTLKYILLDSTFVFDKDDEFVADISANEVSGTGYTGGYGGGGRKSVGTRTSGHNGTSHKAYIDADDVTWTAIDAGTIGAVGVIKETGGSDATAIFIGAQDITDNTTNGGDWKLELHADGLFTLA